MAGGGFAKRRPGGSQLGKKHPGREKAELAASYHAQTHTQSCLLDY